MKISKREIADISTSFGLEYAAVMSIIATETPMKGFINGKIIIQFEPVWFRRKQPFAPSGKWSVNKVDIQKQEWIAFNSAFAIHPDSAMESTSIGMPQILGLHWKRLEYGSVGEMWDDFKTGEPAQVKALCKFITTDKGLFNAVSKRNWSAVARIYNGKNYKAMAKKWGREPYDITLKRNYDIYCK